MSVTEFVGVSTTGGLYEFWTTDGAHVYLHDTDFRHLTYHPGRPPVLELEFVYNPEVTPPELSETPVVVFRFENARLVEWREDEEGHDAVIAHPDAPPGQVELFDWNGTDQFTLITFTLHLTFQASLAEVKVRAG